MVVRDRLAGWQRLRLRGSAVVVAVGLDLLELVGGEDGGELLPRLLVDGVHLLCMIIGEIVVSFFSAAIFWSRSARIGSIFAD